MLHVKVNTVYNEDCRATMKRMEAGSIDLVITSPPYDNLRTYGQRKSVFPFEPIAVELFRVLKPGGVLVWIVADATINGSESGTSFKQALSFKQCGFNLFDTIIYAKPPRGAVGNNQGYWQCFEYMFVFAKGKPKTINLLRDRINKESRAGDSGTKRLKDGTLKKVRRGGYSNFGRRTNIWEYAIGKGHSASDSIAHRHPAIFPEQLARDHVLSWSKAGDLVYDPMMGSGTVAKVCMQLNRKFIGSEINKNYWQVCKKRISGTQQQLFNK